METVGSYEAKTHLPRLLKRVARGERITITHRGLPVAMLVPPPATQPEDVKAVIEAFKAYSKGRSLRGLTPRELIEDGRRF